jgi:hypothetical protein
MLFEIFIGIIFVILVGIQIFAWCQILTGFVFHYKFKKSIMNMLPLKHSHDDDSYQGYA